ncbi:uncharacterized protein LOC143241701 [Tachypleus tridentatus]|uniref:uncharacterized protein LOC143241701 n=1 Tax=Tachypleus tridentatus TaxID=6853 RepID=UPI003FD30C3C
MVVVSLSGTLAFILFCQGCATLSLERNQTFHVVHRVGDHVILHCDSDSDQYVMVAWIKKNEDELLSIQDRMFTSDPRVSVQTSGSNSWCLLIQNIQQADSGLYECVIGSDSHPLQRNTFHLKVEASHSNSPLLETNKRGKNKRRRELKPTSFSRLIADSYLYDSTEEEPSIVDITKLTVRSGKDAILQCTVENLGHHKLILYLEEQSSFHNCLQAVKVDIDMEHYGISPTCLDAMVTDIICYDVNITGN